MWKTIERFPDYQVSDNGRVRSFCRYPNGRFLKPGTNRLGYLYVVLYLYGERNYCVIHRLVLETFVGPWPEGMETNHLDGDKRNNRVENLEWVTHSENMIHAYQNGLKTPNIEKKVRQFTKGRHFVDRYKSLSEASRQTGVNLGHLSECCTGKRKSAGGFIWRFADAS